MAIVSESEIEEEEEQGRVVQIIISRYSLATLLDVPAHWNLVDVFPDAVRPGVFRIIFTSKTFLPIEEGEAIPRLKLTYSRNFSRPALHLTQVDLVTTDEEGGVTHVDVSRTLGISTRPEGAWPE